MDIEDDEPNVHPGEAVTDETSKWLCEFSVLRGYDQSSQSRENLYNKSKKTMAESHAFCFELFTHANSADLARSDLRLFSDRNWILQSFLLLYAGLKDENNLNNSTFSSCLIEII